MNQSYIIVTGAYTAISGNLIQANTSGGAFTLTLPSTASIGDYIEVEDAVLTWDAHHLTINRNGLKINGTTSNYTASVIGNKLSIVYISTSYGWSIK